jgi:hypothetical protein
LEDIDWLGRVLLKMGSIQTRFAALLRRAEAPIWLDAGDGAGFRSQPPPGSTNLQSELQLRVPRRRGSSLSTDRACCTKCTAPTAGRWIGSLPPSTAGASAWAALLGLSLSASGKMTGEGDFIRRVDWVEAALVREGATPAAATRPAPSAGRLAAAMSSAHNNFLQRAPRFGSRLIIAIRIFANGSRYFTNRALTRIVPVRCYRTQNIYITIYFLRFPIRSRFRQGLR